MVETVKQILRQYTNKLKQKKEQKITAFFILVENTNLSIPMKKSNTPQSTRNIKILHSLRKNY